MKLQNIDSFAPDETEPATDDHPEGLVVVRLEDVASLDAVGRRILARHVDEESVVEISDAPDGQAVPVDLPTHRALCLVATVQEKELVRAYRPAYRGGGWVALPDLSDRSTDELEALADEIEAKTERRAA